MWFDKLTTNGINTPPFVLSLLKDGFGSSFVEDCAIKTLFASGPAQEVRLFIAVVLAVVLMIADHRGEHVSGVRRTIATALTPVFYLAQAPGSFYRWFSDALTSRQRLQGENESLKDELFLTRTQLQRLVALEAENARLRNLLGAARKTRGQRLVAEIIDIDLGSHSHQVLLNRGARHGVFEGQAVLDAFGVFGQVVEVSDFASRVLLVSDLRHALPVRVERTGFNAVAEGAGAMNTLKLRFVPDNADVQIGDLLVSSGLGQRFPEGFPVGQITRIERDTGESYADITLVSAARLEQSGEVILLWPEQEWRPSGAEGERAPDPAVAAPTPAAAVPESLP